MRISRRRFVGTLTGASVATITGTQRLFAQNNESIRVGLLAAKTGPLASGGIDMDLALTMFLKERENVLAGRKVELTLGVSAAEDMTQRHPSPWYVRLTSTSAQCAYPLAEYAVKELKYKKVVTIADDFAYGHEMCAGFQRAFEDNGGKITQKIFTPLATPDYGSYVAQVKSADAIFLGTAGSNGFRFLRQFVEYGLKDKMAVIGGMTALDESVLRNMGDEAMGILTTSWYSAELDNPLNKSFAPA